MAISGREILEAGHKQTVVRIIRGLPLTSVEAGLVLANMLSLEIQVKTRRQKLAGPTQNFFFYIVMQSVSHRDNKHLLSCIQESCRG